MNYLLLIIATAIWGMGFVATKWTFTDFSALWSNGIRFAFAGAIAVPALIYYKTHQRSLKNMLWVLAASFVLGSSMLLQTLGLVYTSAAKSGFITCLYSAFIPLIGIVFFKKKFSSTYWFLLALSLVGIALLCDLDWRSFNIGDYYTLLCAMGFAIHFLLIEKIANKFDSGFELNALQCFFVGFIAVAFAYAWEGGVDWGPALVVSDIVQGKASASLGFLSLSLLSSFVAFGICANVQKSISAASVGVICLMESPFAAIFGYLFLGEKLNQTNIAGACLVMLSVLLIPFADRIQAHIRLNRIFAKKGYSTT